MYCSITIIGRVSSEIDLKYLKKSGIPVCKFDVAVNKIIKNKEKKVNFYHIEVWGNYGEVVSNHLSKGQLIFLTGTGDFDDWVDDNGKKQMKFKVISNNIKYLDSKKENAYNQEIDEMARNMFGGDDDYAF